MRILEPSSLVPWSPPGPWFSRVFRVFRGLPARPGALGASVHPAPPAVAIPAGRLIVVSIDGAMK